VQKSLKDMPDQDFHLTNFNRFLLRINALSTCINIVFRYGPSDFFIPKARMVVQSR